MSAKRWMALSLWAALATVALAADPAARVTHLEKEVSFKQTGQADWTVVKVNDPLTQGDLLRTGAGARAEVTYTDGSVVRVAESSTLALSQPQKKGWGRLLFGKMWLQAVKGKNMRVITPTATASVLGTEFLLQVDEEQNTKIIVFGGSVQFTGSLGDSVTVNGGQWGLAKPETPLQPPQPAPLDQVRKAEPWINPWQ